jgi:hypothetical protein
MKTLLQIEVYYLRLEDLYLLKLKKGTLAE